MGTDTKFKEALDTQGVVSISIRWMPAVTNYLYFEPAQPAVAEYIGPLYGTELSIARDEAIAGTYRRSESKDKKPNPEFVIDFMANHMIYVTHSHHSKIVKEKRTTRLDLYARTITRPRCTL